LPGRNYPGSGLQLFDSRISSGFYQADEQTLRQKVRLSHPFRMPLNAGNPVRVSRPFHRFDNSV
jgi:hypothetical protein